MAYQAGKPACLSDKQTQVIIEALDTTGLEQGTIWFDSSTRTSYILIPDTSVSPNDPNNPNNPNDPFDNPLVWWPITAPLIDNASGGVIGDLAPIDGQSLWNILNRDQQRQDDEIAQMRLELNAMNSVDFLNTNEFIVKDKGGIQKRQIIDGAISINKESQKDFSYIYGGCSFIHTPDSPGIYNLAIYPDENGDEKQYTYDYTVCRDGFVQDSDINKLGVGGMKITAI